MFAHRSARCVSGGPVEIIGSRGELVNPAVGCPRWRLRGSGGHPGSGRWRCRPGGLAPGPAQRAPAPGQGWLQKRAKSSQAGRSMLVWFCSRVQTALMVPSPFPRCCQGPARRLAARRPGRLKRTPRGERGERARTPRLSPQGSRRPAGWPIPKSPGPTPQTVTRPSPRFPCRTSRSARCRCRTWSSW